MSAYRIQTLPKMSGTSKRLSPKIIIALLVSVVILHNTTIVEEVQAARSLSARRVRNSRSNDPGEKYDRSITTFSPEGRLLQLEYSLIAAERGRGLTVCVEWNGVVIFAFPTASSASSLNLLTPAPMSTSASPSSSLSNTGGLKQNNESASDTDLTSPGLRPLKSLSVGTAVGPESNDDDPSHNTKVYRLSPTHLFLTSGIAGDARILASAFRRLVSRWTHLDYGEAVSTRELAQELGKVRHGLGLRPGARVLGVIGVLIGLDYIENLQPAREREEVGLGAEIRMYRSLPGGTIDRCEVCCSGGGAGPMGNLVRKEVMEALSQIIAPKTYDDNPKKEGADCSLREMENSKDDELPRIIEEVGKVALKYHPDSRSDVFQRRDDKNIDPKNETSLVDIWVVRAVSENKSSEQTLKHDGDVQHRTEERHPVPTAYNNKYSSTFVSSHRRLGRASMSILCARHVSLEQISNAARCFRSNDKK